MATEQRRACRAALLPACLAALLPACAPAPPPAGELAQETTLALNGVANGGFEWIADATTDPPKHGAYWVGAFSPEPGDPTDRVVEAAPFRGARCLRLEAGAGEVLQKVVADPRWTAQASVGLAVRLEGQASLLLTLEDGPGRTVTARVGPDGRCPKASRRLPAAGGWTRLWLPLGRAFAARHGEPPVPRLNLRLRCEGPQGSAAFVDEVVVQVLWPRVEEAALARRIAESITWQLDTWYLPPEQGGLRLVDPTSGRADTINYDVTTGGERVPAGSVGLHSIHRLLLRWLELARERGWEDELARWTPVLRTFTRTLLEDHFDPSTGLPRSVRIGSGQPNQRSPVTVASFLEFLLDAADLVNDPALARRCVAQARHAADTLLALQRAHDHPPGQVPNDFTLDPASGKLQGDFPNWFGHIPNRLTPLGQIDTPRRFNTAWAIVTGKTFWYHLFKSASAIVAVHERAPKPGDLEGVRRALSRYRREWDASRYDLENDTDDHYGYLCEDLLEVVRHGAGQLPRALTLVQQATDHRLPRTAASAADTPWIQGVRLGTPCAGDSPRAFLGVLGLMQLGPDLNPATHDLPLYAEALLELARNDFKGRQLTNAQFTESFFGMWEMVCICYRGTFQGDCRSHPPEFWHGDVGDTFGGPPASAIDAQNVALRVASPGQRPEILAGLSLLRHVTDRSLRAEHGYLSGLDPAVARQYQLPDRYVTGLRTQSTAGLAHVMAWARLLPFLQTGPEPGTPRLQPGGVRDATRVVGPPGGSVRVLLQPLGQAFPAPLSPTDARMLALDPVAAGAGITLVLDDAGQGLLDLPALEQEALVAQPLLLDPQGGAPLAVGPPRILGRP